MLAVTVLLSYYTGRFHNALKYTLLDIGLIIFFFVLLYFVYLQNKKWIKNAALVLTVCIILSTMFLKQHSVFDVLTAFALAAFMYSVCYGSIAVAFERRRQKRIPAGQI